MDDCLLPLGSALLTGALGEAGKDGGRLTVATSLGEDELPLEPGQLRLVDLPPGIVARIDLDPGGGTVLGVAGRPMRLEVSGGLGGLLATPVPSRSNCPAAPSSAGPRSRAGKCPPGRVWTDERPGRHLGERPRRRAP
jgi:hypothetical protein